MNRFLSNKKYFLLLTILLSILFLGLVISKVFFTPIGYDSIGRMFHYYVNYDDFGFIKRGLWGTTLHYLNLNNFMENTYIEYIIIYMAVSIAFIMMFWYFFSKKTPPILSIQDVYLALIAILSPSIFLHLGYAPGNFDVILMLIFIINIIIVERGKIYTASLISAGAILVHEVYLLSFLPFLLWLLLEKYDLKTAIKFCIPPIISMSALLLWGKLAMTKEDYISQLEKISPLLLKRDGYFELTSSISENINIGISSLSNPENWRLTPVAIVYTILIYLFLLRYIDRKKIKYFYVGILASIMPLSLSIVGNDVFRWLSFVVFNLFIFMLIERKSDFSKPTKMDIVLVIIISLFVFLGPMGSVFNNRPFPIIQTLLHIE